MTSKIIDLLKDAHQTAIDHGWWEEDQEPQYQSPTLNRPIGLSKVNEKLLLAVSEIAEAMEELRDGRDPNEVYYRASDGKPEGFPMELADVMIRLADLCGVLGVDLDKAIAEKSEFNKSRPHRHGGKQC